MEADPRSYLDLNGPWEFEIDPSASLDGESIAYSRTISVPGPWQAQHPDLLRYAGVAWYRRRLTIDAVTGNQPGHATLHFGAVDHTCQVWVNGQLAGSHAGGYLPVILPVGHLIQPGENTITVRVEDWAYERLPLERWSDAWQAEPAAHLLHGKQGWYIDTSGIWGESWLMLSQAPHISSLRVTPDLPGSQAHVEVTLSDEHSLGASASLRVAIALGPLDGEPQATGELVLTGLVGSVTIPLPNPRPWSPEDPFLYQATATLYGTDQAAAPLDAHTVRFGMRSIETRDGRLWLNGQPLYLRAALDQDFYPDTIYTPPSEDYLREQFRLAREMGLNCMRVHIKPADPRYLDLCDEMGLLVWAELPSWRSIWPKERLDGRISVEPALQAEVEATFAAMLARDWNHPSIIIWTLVNEDWGTQLIFSASDRAWLSDFYTRAKALDPTRLIVDNSPCPSAHGPNFHVQSDLDDFHVYASMPDRYHTFRRWLEDFSLRPTWSYSTFGEAVRRGDEPLLVSEFGTWGLPTVAAMRPHWPEGQPPAWWTTGAWWGSLGGEMSYPVGAEERFAEARLNEIWPDYDSFALATQAHEGRALKAQIEAIRGQPTIQGYVITEFTDLYWEANGLLDMYRQPKSFHGELPAYNADDVIIPSWQRTSHWAGERLAVPLTLSHWSGLAEGASRLRWSVPELGLEGGWELGSVAKGETRPIGAIVARLPDVGAARSLRMAIALEGEGGAPITETFHDFMVLPTSLKAPHTDRPLWVYDPRYPDLHGQGDEDPHLGSPEVLNETQPLPVGLPVSAAPIELGLPNSLREQGYQISHPGDEDALLVATRMNARLMAEVRAGRDLLFFPRESSPFLTVMSRGGLRNGDWISAFHWLHPELPLSFPVENPLGFAFGDILPQHVIIGHGPRMGRDVLAGLVTGWAHLPAATMCQFRYGRGRVLMSTWRLNPYAGIDPMATVLLHDVIAYITSDNFRPEMAL